jgi:hypothetical protein
MGLTTWLILFHRCHSSARSFLVFFLFLNSLTSTEDTSHRTTKIHGPRAGICRLYCGAQVSDSVGG